LAFDGVAASFDQRFGQWLSVAAQRNAVRRELLRIFPRNGRILEIGGGTGEDAHWLAARDFRVHLTDPSPSMVEIARNKLAGTGSPAEIAAAEDLEQFAMTHLSRGGELFQGAFSNFAPLNCVEDLTPVGRGLARLIEPGGSAVLVLFGTASPGEMLTEVLHGRPRQALRRFRRRPVPASIGGRTFTVTYHRPRVIRAALHPWFRYVQRRGIGIFVPPSAAEPWISRHARLLRGLEALDNVASGPLAALGDHVLYVFERTGVPSP
jgi:SAM-dependent methyltransferase